MKTANYDERKVPRYTLPDPLTLENGGKVENPDDWLGRRRPEILSLFEEHVYGRAPSAKPEIKFETESSDEKALGGKAARREISIKLSRNNKKHCIRLLLYIPGKTRPAPVFLGLNFWGNHSVCRDPGIKLPDGWFRGNGEGIVNNRATESSRGASEDRWQVEKIIDSGFALATLYYGDLEPDHPQGWKEGIRAFLHPEGKNAEFAPSDWGAVGAWAWGLSRAMDYLEEDKDTDHAKTAVMGHSRLGKASLWAGARDERFRIVISNNSGCGGAALSRRRFGETLYHINTLAPHWFCGNFKNYNGKEDSLPADQHQLIALIAPRPVYIASAEEDLWADPKGEFLAAKNAEPAYRLFDKPGPGAEEMPAVNTPVGDFIGYHIREGKHGVTAFDREQYIRFAKRHFSL